MFCHATTLRLLTSLALFAPAYAVAEERGDTTRICIAPAGVEAATGNASTVAEAVHAAFTSYLTGPSLGVTPLKARLASQVREEARQAGCPYLLLTTIKHVQKRGGGSLLGRVAAGAAQQGAWEAGMASGSAAGRIAGQAAYGAAGQAVSDYAYTVRNKDELTLGYRLETADGKALIENKDKRKAKSDGEDLLTPVVEKAAEAIAVAVGKGGR